MVVADRGSSSSEWCETNGQTHEDGVEQLHVARRDCCSCQLGKKLSCSCFRGCS
jgi:hypothetical protein